jgi:hypothetical protein
LLFAKTDNWLDVDISPDGQAVDEPIAEELRKCKVPRNTRCVWRLMVLCVVGYGLVRFFINVIRT